jgi:hypothetical protein
MDRERRVDPDERRPDGERERPAEEPAPAIGDRLSPIHVMALQRTAGNRAVQRLLADTGGLSARPQPDDPELTEDLGGDPEPTGTGTATPTGDSGGTPVTIGTTTVTGPTWGNHGQFNWEVGFTTSGKSGWIVQEITATRTGTTSSGAVAAPATPHYWEAWAVDGSSKVTPAHGAVNDIWSRRAWGAGSKGEWTMGGKVHFTTTDPATQGFTAGAVPEAGILLSTTTAPSGLGDVKLTRSANGKWDSTGAAPTHTGKAGP